MPFQYNGKEYVSVQEAVTLGYVNITPSRLRARIKKLKPSQKKDLVASVKFGGFETMIIETEFVKKFQALRKKHIREPKPDYVTYEQRLKTIHTYIVDHSDKSSIIEFADKFKCDFPYFYTYTKMKDCFVLHLILPFHKIDESEQPNIKMNYTSRNFGSLHKILSNAEKNIKTVFKNIEYQLFLTKYLN